MLLGCQDLSQVRCLHPYAAHRSRGLRHLDAQLTVAASLGLQGRGASGRAAHQFEVEHAVLARQSEGL